VKYAPAAVPSWRDMVPGSPFQREIFERPLDPRITACLGFTITARAASASPRATTAPSPCSSQLADAAQAQAALDTRLRRDAPSVLRSSAALARSSKTCLARPEPAANG
jgi:hypothetical protein